MIFSMILIILSTVSKKIYYIPTLAFVAAQQEVCMHRQSLDRIQATTPNWIKIALQAYTDDQIQPLDARSEPTFNHHFTSL